MSVLAELELPFTEFFLLLFGEFKHLSL